MQISEALIAEFTHEAATTRKLLERLPEDKLSWKPHEKSMSLGDLATHIAHIPEWSQTVANDDAFDLAKSPMEGPKPDTRQGILDYFDKSVEGFTSSLQGKTDEHLFQSWKLQNDGKTVIEMPRAACLRSFILSHGIHHRGQLSVYLRLNDVPLPSIYGPSADEGI